MRKRVRDGVTYIELSETELTMALAKECAVVQSSFEEAEEQFGLSDDIEPFYDFLGHFCARVIADIFR